MDTTTVIAVGTALVTGLAGGATAIWRFVVALLRQRDEQIAAQQQEISRLNEERLLLAERAAQYNARYERIIEKQGEIIRAQKVTLDAHLS